MSDAIEAPAVEVDAAAEDVGQVEPAKGTGVVLHPASRPPGREVLMPADAAQVIEGMKAYQSLLHELLDESDWQATGDGRFPKKSAWRKIARAFNLSVEIVSYQVERDDEGRPLRAECVARAIAPNGQVQDADGYCSLSEFTGRRADDVKLENTLRATATTRAKNRAIADLVGMGEVSAEEVVPAAQSEPAFQRATDDDQAAAKLALGGLVGRDVAFDIWKQAVEGFGGTAPAPFARALIAIAAQSSVQGDGA